VNDEKAERPRNGRFYGLCRTLASHLAMTGVNLGTGQELMGHTESEIGDLRTQILLAS